MRHDLPSLSLNIFLFMKKIARRKTERVSGEGKRERERQRERHRERASGRERENDAALCLGLFRTLCSFVQ